MCKFCKSGNLIESKTTHIVNYKKGSMVVKNVPCWECEQCGRKFYTDEVSEKLKMIDDMMSRMM